MSENFARSVPQTSIEQLMASIGSGTGNARDWMNQKLGLPFVETGFGAGDMIFGEGPEMLNEMSWGKSPILPSGHGFRIDPRIADVAGIAGLFGVPAKGMLKQGIKEFGLPKHPSYNQQGYIVTPHNTELFDEAMGNKAFDMKLDGATDEEIFAATKTYASHKDGVLRQEIAHGDEKYMTNEELMQEHTEIMERKFFEPESEFPLDEKRATAIENLLSNDFDVSEPGMLKDRLFNSPLEKENKEWFDSIAHREATSWDEGSLGSWSSGKPYHQLDDGRFAEYSPTMMIDNNLLNAKPEDAIGQLADEIKALGIQDTVRHEGSHALTGRGGRTGGGHHETVPNILRADLYEQLFEMDKRREFLEQSGQTLSDKDLARVQDLQDHFNSVGDLDSDQLHTLYQALSDESQSRLVQDRWQMTQKEMDADPFYLKYPVSPSEMIMTPDSMPKAGFDQEVFESEVSNVLKKLADEKNRKSKLALDDPAYWD